MRRVLRLPGYTAWLASRSISWAGDSIMMLVLSMWVKTITGSNALAGVTFAFLAGPAILGAFAGILVDRLPKKSTLVWGNLASALVPVPLFFVHDGHDVWLIWLSTLGFGISYVLLPATSSVILKQLVPERDMPDAQSFQSAIGNGLQLVGPLIGAGLFAWRGGATVAAVDIACFLLSAAFATRLHVPPIARVTEGSTAWAELVAGLRYVARTRLLLDITVAILILFAFSGFLQGALYALCDAMGKPATFASLIATAQGLGMVVGSLAMGLVIRRLGEVRAMIGGLVLASLAIIAVTTTTRTAPVLALMALAGLALPAVFVSYNTLQFRLTPAHILGRVGTAVGSAQGVANVVSLMVGALLVAAVPWQAVYLSVAFAALAAAGWLAVRRRGHLELDPEPVVVPAAAAADPVP